MSNVVDLVKGKDRIASEEIDKLLTSDVPLTDEEWAGRVQRAVGMAMVAGFTKVTIHRMSNPHVFLLYVQGLRRNGIRVNLQDSENIQLAIMAGLV